MTFYTRAIKTLLLVLFSSIPFSAWARTLILEPVTTDEGCKVIDFHDTIKADSKKMVNASWSGNCKDGYTDGVGVLRAMNGEGTREVSNGTMVKGKFVGEVTSVVSRKDGSKTTARVQFSSGMPNGFGEVETVKAGGQKMTYSGNFKDGLPDGAGKLVNPSITVVGTFLEGKPTGVMTVTPSDGKWVYEGKLTEQLKFEGQGTLIYPNKTRITTNFTDGKPSSTGRIEYANGVVYEGLIINGKPDGVGKLTLSTGMIVSGQFSEGKPAGVMTVTPSDGKWVYEGKLTEQLRFDGQGTLTYPNKSRLTTTFTDGRPGSTGRFEYGNGDVYEGQLQGVTPHGIGKVTRASDGQWYEGDFKNGRPDGNGMVGDISGRRTEASFADGKIIRRNAPDNARQQSSSSPGQARGESGWETLGKIFDAIATGVVAADTYSRSQMPSPQQQATPAQMPMPQSPGVYVSERIVGVSKFCYYNNAGTPVAITVKNFDICPR